MPFCEKPYKSVWKNGISETMLENINPFPSKGFPIDEQNRLALDRVKSIVPWALIRQLRG